MKETDQPIQKEEAHEVDRSDPEMSKGKRDRAGRSQIPRMGEGVHARERSVQKTRATLHAELHKTILIAIEYLNLERIPVILSQAKDHCVRRVRSFAALRMTGRITLKSAHGTSSLQMSGG